MAGKMHCDGVEVILPSLNELSTTVSKEVSNMGLLKSKIKESLSLET